MDGMEFMCALNNTRYIRCDHTTFTTSAGTSSLSYFLHFRVLLGLVSICKSGLNLVHVLLNKV